MLEAYEPPKSGMEKTGRAFEVAYLAREYGFTDVDGGFVCSRPD